MGAFQKVKAILESRNLDSLKITQIPQPESLVGVENAANLLREAILEGKKLAIIGDYDADGICATCIMREFFAALSREIRREIPLTFKIPNRFTDGYGANPAMIGEIDADIFITVDNGISAFEAAAACQKLGKTLIITDHHKPLVEKNGEVLPSAAIIINPHLSAADFAQKDICGAVVAWYLCGGIKKAFGANLDLKALTRFLAIAIIADMMPLFGLNRALYKLGIAQIQATSDPAFVALREKYALDSGEIGFKIAPLINSVGRLRDAQIALDFFAARTKAAATAALDSLIALNNERKTTQNAVFSAAKDSAFSTQNLVVAFGNDWHLGVLGIVAARLSEDSGKSAFCFSLKDGVLKGSGRSNSRVNLIATIQRCTSFLLHFGGHSGAVGLSLSRENLDGFVAAFEENLMPDSPPDSPPPIEISLVEADLALLALLESFEPYGMGNEELRFVARGVRVEATTQIGTNGNHQRLRISQNATIMDAFYFDSTEDWTHQALDITFQLKRDNRKQKQKIILQHIAKAP